MLVFLGLNGTADEAVIMDYSAYSEETLPPKASSHTAILLDNLQKKFADFSENEARLFDAEFKVIAGFLN